MLYNKEVLPNVLELGRLKIEICHQLHKKRQEIKLSGIQNEKLDELVFDFLEDAFSVVEPDEATKALYSKYSSSSYDEEISNQESAMKEEFSDLFYQQFGIRFDPSLLTENPDLEKIEEELKNNGNKKKPGKRESPKQKSNRKKSN